MPALSTNSRSCGRSFVGLLGGPLPVLLGRGRRVDPHLDHHRGREVGVVAEHGDLALEGRVLEVLPAGDLALGQLGVVGQPDQARLPGDGELVARVVGRVLDRRGGVLGEVGQLGVVELDQEVLADQLLDRAAVGDHDQVPAGVLAGLEGGVDLAQEGVVLVDDLFVVDLDPRLLGEVLERGVHGLAALTSPGPCSSGQLAKSSRLAWVWLAQNPEAWGASSPPEPSTPQAARKAEAPSRPAPRRASRRLMRGMVRPRSRAGSSGRFLVTAWFPPWRRRAHRSAPAAIPAIPPGRSARPLRGWRTRSDGTRRWPSRHR